MKKKINIKIFPEEKVIIASKGDILAEKIIESGININAYCNKKGICGKCFVEIKKGNIKGKTENEKKLIKQKKYRKNYRLACQYEIENEVIIRIPDESIINETLILKTGIKAQILINNTIKKYFIEIERPKISLPYSLLEVVKRELKNKRLSININQLKELSRIHKNEKYGITAVIYKDKEILNIEKNDTRDQSYGIAVDIGTTTLVVEVIDLNSGRTVDTIAEQNSQIKYGSDVISRIAYAISSRKNLDELRDSVLAALNKMIKEVLARNKLNKDRVYEIVVAANTTMNHLFLGLPVSTLAVSPYNAVFSILPELSTAEIGFKINKYCKIYIVPNIKSFVGGDISAGIIASDFENREGNYLFIDLGTNGELVLKKGDRFVTTSTAAGPAFEGMNISHGMLALPGAIYKAENTHRLILNALGKKKPKGICGTGLIDLISIFLKKGEITSKGAIKDKAKKIKITDNIFITQKDIREMQLAVAAVKAGTKMILQKFNMKLRDLDGIFIAGAFGNYLNIENSISIGLLPKISKNKIIFIGNSSIGGAKALLLSNEARKKVESLTKKIQHFSLATKHSFQQQFIDAIEFKN